MHDTGVPLEGSAPLDSTFPFDVSSPGDAGASILRGAFPNPPSDASQDGGLYQANEAVLLEGQVGTLDLELFYHSLKTPFPTASELASLQDGRIPVISLGCSPVTNQAVANGDADSEYYIPRIREMQATGKLIILRWFWEMNLLSTSNGREGCFDPSYDTYVPADDAGFFNPTEYIAAWKHIHGLVASLGATNVKMFFCGSGGTPATMSKYYPGDDYVELNGFDVYDRMTNQDFHDTVVPAYAAAIDASSHRPIWIGETGAFAPQWHTDAGYIGQGTREMLATSFPLLTAVIYFDAIGTSGDWYFDDAGLAGFKAFGKP
jgi:Glycosyl hydrolase family 26